MGWIALVLSLPVAAPLLRATGWERPADALYLLYRPLCHQRPERSFHIMDEQMAFCERDLAIFLAIGTTALMYAVAQRFIQVPRIPWLFLIALMLPIVIDGGTQLAGLRESTTFLRLLTGTLFGVAAAAVSLPVLDDGFTNLRCDIEQRLGSHTGAVLGSER